MQYIVYNPDTLPYTHDPFFVVTTPEITDFTLCGEIAYEGRYKGTAVGETGDDPLTYVSSTRTFTVDTDNEDLIDTIQPYQVYATFVNYPPTNPSYSGVTTLVSEEVIDFDNPCLDPFNFAVTG